MTPKKIAIATALLTLAALGGCHRPEPQPEPSDNASTVEDNVATPSPTPAPAAANVAAPTDANVSAASELRAAPPAPDAQTQDDADATGMTAHVRRDEAAGNSTAP